MSNIRKGAVVTSLLVSMLLSGCGSNVADNTEENTVSIKVESNVSSEIENKYAVENIEDIAIGYVYYDVYSPYSVLYNDGTFAYQADDFSSISKVVNDMRVLAIQSEDPEIRLCEYFIEYMNSKNKTYTTTDGVALTADNLLDKTSLKSSGYVRLDSFNLLSDDDKVALVSDMYYIADIAVHIDSFIESKHMTIWYNALRNQNSEFLHLVDKVQLVHPSATSMQEGLYITPRCAVTFSKDKIEEYYDYVLSHNMQEFEPTHSNDDGIMVTEYPDKYVVIRYRDIDGDADNDIVYYQLSDEDYESIIAKSVEYRQIAEKNAK